MGETLHRRIFFLSVETFPSAPPPGTPKRVRHFTIRRVHTCTNSGGGKLEHLLPIVIWYNDGNSQVINLGMDNVKILRQLVVKYNAVKPFIIRCNVLINLKEPIISGHFMWTFYFVSTRRNQFWCTSKYITHILYRQDWRLSSKHF